MLDPFAGAGTTGLVASRLGRDSVLVEIDASYAEMARERIDGDAPLLAHLDAAQMADPAEEIPLFADDSATRSFRDDSTRYPQSP